MIMPTDSDRRSHKKSEEKAPVPRRTNTESVTTYHDTPTWKNRSLTTGDQGPSRSMADVVPSNSCERTSDDPPPLPSFSVGLSRPRTRTGGFHKGETSRARNQSTPETPFQAELSGGHRYLSTGSIEQTTRYPSRSPVVQYSKRGRRVSDPDKSSSQSGFLPPLDKTNMSTFSPQTSLGSHSELQCAREYSGSSMSALDLKEDVTRTSNRSNLSLPCQLANDDMPQKRDESAEILAAVRRISLSPRSKEKSQGTTLLSNLDPNQSLNHDFKFCRYQAKYASKGSQGEVYRGIDPNTKKAVAIKITAPNESKFKLTNSLTELTIYRKLEKLEGVRSPNICYSLGIHELPKKTYIIMPWYPLSLLDTMTKCGRIPMVDSLTIILRLLNGVEYLHHNKIAHRDIKAENVLLTTPNLKVAQPVLCDFGLCGTMDSGAIMTSQCGSRSYAAPEVKNKSLRYNESGGYDARKADIFSVGVLLFSMIHAFFPWSSANMETASWKEWHDRPRVFFKWAAKHSEGVRLSNNFRTAFRGMCHPNPARRMSIAGVRSLLEDELKKEQS